MTVAIIMIAVGVAAIIWLASHRRARDWTTEPTDVAPGGSDVSVLRLAIDASASKFVESELERITRQLTGANLVREAGVLLRRVREQWLYGGAINEPLRSLGETQAVFAKHVAAARSPVAGAPATSDARSALVVSIIVAAQSELVTVSQANVAEELRRALEAAAYRSDLVAVEVVWSSCAASELPTRFPELLAIGSTLAGKVLCASCGGPFPAELVSCPHCGAPAPGRAA